LAESSAQQIALTDIALRTDPADVSVRPLESIPVQALYYGEADEQRIRLRLDGALWDLGNENSGWLSKSYRFQGEESEPFYQPPNQGLSSIIFGCATSQFLRQDSVVYTTPRGGWCA
jgi:hypothetical protein